MSSSLGTDAGFIRTNIPTEVRIVDHQTPVSLLFICLFIYLFVYFIHKRVSIDRVNIGMYHASLRKKKIDDDYIKVNKYINDVM